VLGAATPARLDVGEGLFPLAPLEDAGGEPAHAAAPAEVLRPASRLASVTAALPQAHAHPGERAVQAALDGAEAHPEGLGDLLEAHVLVVPQHDHRALALGQPPQRDGQRSPASRPCTRRSGDGPASAREAA